jgi:hypothetical protein
VSRKTRSAFGAIIVTAVVVASPFALSAQTRVAIAVNAIHTYQAFASPVLAKTGVRCRFQPTCSHYAEQAVQKYGVFEGSVKAGRRLLRCTPFTPMGTVDLP